jgi:hypothetical protein
LHGKNCTKRKSAIVWDINGEDYWIIDEIVPDQTRKEQNIKKDTSYD